MGLFSTYNSVEEYKPVTIKEDVVQNPDKLERLLDVLRRPIYKVNTNTDQSTQESSNQITPNLDWFSNVDSITNTGTKLDNTNYKSMDLATVLKLSGLDKDIKITSGYRTYNIGKAGDKSNHRHKNEYGHSMAYDIIPVNGDFKSMYNKMKNNSLMMSWLTANKFNINDETTKDSLKQTGGTGAHFHIGPDSFNIYKG